MSETQLPVDVETVASAPAHDEVEVIFERPLGPALTRQPWAGIAGTLIVAGLMAALAIAPGGPQTALQVSIPIVTYALPVLVVMALWWGRWPADRLNRPASLAINTLILAAAGFGLTVAGQAVVGRVDLDGLFSQATDQLPQAGGHLTGFPFTFPLAGMIFVAMAQLTLINERKPFDRLGRVWSGVAALATAWAVGLVGYGLVANWDAVPAPARDLLSLRNPDGPVFAVDIVGWLVCIVMWQVTFGLVLGGWPFSGIKATGTRLFVANVTVIGGGWLTYLAMHDLFGWPIPVIGGVGGSVVAGVVVAALIFEGWPFRSETPALAGFGLAVAVAAVAAGVYWGLKALGNGIDDWTQYPVELWVGTTALVQAAAAGILYVLIWDRWPLPRRDASNADVPRPG
jgi:hypothetical protein